MYACAGLLFGELLEKNNMTLLWGFICVPVIMLICIKSRNSLCETMIICLLFLFCLFGGNIMYERTCDKLTEYDTVKEGEQVRIEGEVRNIWDSKYGITVEMKNESDGISIICYFKEFELEIGRKAVITGKKQMLERATNKGQFDVKEYYNSKKIFMVLSKCEVKNAGEEYSELLNGFYLIRQSLKKAIVGMCDEEEAGVICAILLGDKEYLDNDIKDMYTASGIGHILCISALHISLAGGTVYKFLRRFTRQPVAFMVSGMFMICYCATTGAGVSTLRAVIMFMLGTFAKILGQKYDIKNSMAISMTWVLLENPLYINNGGFLLSFLSVSGIAFVLPYINELFEDWLECRKENRIRSLVTQSAGAFITSATLYFVTLMAISSTYYEVPIYAIILNTLLLPLMGAVVISGFLGGILFYVAESLGKVSIFISIMILKIYKLVCGIFENMPFNTYITGEKSRLQICVYYMVLVLIVGSCLWMKRKKCSMKKIVMVLATGMALLLGLVLYRKPYEFKLIFLDVGQGDCIYIESPEGRNYLVDCGSSDEGNIGRYKLKPFLKSMGRDRLTAIFVTHADMDHVSGVIELLENDDILVENLLVGKYIPEKNEAYETLCKAAKVKGVDLQEIEGGDKIAGEVEFLCLSPEENVVYDNANCASLVLLGKYGDFKFLLTGDISSAEEKSLIEGEYANLIKNISVLKCAHHGSRYSNCEEFLAVVAPDITIISYGEDNSYGHPHSEVLERLKAVGSRIRCTAEEGMIEVGKTVIVKKN